MLRQEDFAALAGNCEQYKAAANGTHYRKSSSQIRLLGIVGSHGDQKGVDSANDRNAGRIQHGQEKHA
jgi:hypothetical protein